MEILVRLIDKSPAEDSSKRGDVVCIVPDGWAWSADERTRPDWLIVKVGIIDSDRDTLLTQARSLVPGRFRRRDWFIDFTKLALPNRFNFPRAQESVTITRLGFIVAITQKPALA